MANIGIGNLFHIIHVGEALEPPDAFYGAVFGPRRGSHWHSLTWYCRETGAIWNRLEPRGVRMVTDGGNPLNGRPAGERSETSNGSLFTRPKGTGTQLGFCPRVMPDDPRFLPGRDGNWRAASHPLGVPLHHPGRAGRSEGLTAGQAESPASRSCLSRRRSRIWQRPTSRRRCRLRSAVN